MAEYRFDDIAINSTEKKKPVESDKEHYLGLEHLDSGTFKVSRFGSEVAPIGDKLIMKKGDVLFGKRRAYQKKVAIAPFDGIFSAHGMVLRPKEDVIDKNFFPLFIASDYFLDAAIKISVGSLSPTINWRDLKELKFNLPELDEQKKLAEVLWQIVDTMESYKKLLAKTDEMVKAKFVEMFGNDLKENNFKFKKLSEIGNCKNGINFTDKENGNCIHCLGVSDFQNFSEISNCEKLPSISLSEYPSKDYLLKNNDIVFVRSNGNKELVGRSVLVYPNDVDTTFSGFCIRFRIETDDIIPKFLLSYLKTDKARKDLRGRGANIQNLNQQMLSNLLVPIPPIEQQKSFIDIVQKSEESKAAIQASLDSLSAVYKKIIAENLGGE